MRTIARVILFLVAVPAGATTKAGATQAARAFTEVELDIASGRYALPGRLTLPREHAAPAAAAAPKWPAAVLVHDQGPLDEDGRVGAERPLRDLAWGLAARGIVVLRYRKRSFTYADELAAEGGVANTREETVSDARAALKRLAARPEVDSGRLFLIGHGLGAMLAPRIAERNVQVRGLVLLAGNSRPLPVVTIERLRRRAAADLTVTDAEEEALLAAERAAVAIASPRLRAGDVVVLDGLRAPGSWWLDLRGYQPARLASRLKLPVLVVQGGRDQQLSAADFEGWRQALAGSREADFKLYPALDHLLTAEPAPDSVSQPSSPHEPAPRRGVADEVLNDLAAWLRRVPAGTPAPGSAHRARSRGGAR